MTVNEEFYSRLAEEDKYFGAMEDFTETYLTPLEAIVEGIESIVSEQNFGVFNDGYGFAVCYSCDEFNEISEYDDDFTFAADDIIHKENCKVQKLKDLVATLGDMIS